MRRFQSGLLIVVGFGLIAVFFIIADHSTSSTIVQAETSAAPADTGDRAADRAELHSTLQKFTEAFQKGDAAAAAAFMSSGAELIPDEAPPIRGRDAVQKAYAAYFAKNPKAKILLTPESVRFTSRDSAIEEGEMKITPEKGEPTTNRYSIIFIREDGKWLLAVVKEWANEQESLRDLEWLIGSWSSKQSNAEVQSVFEWFGNKSFIRAHFTIREKGKSFTGMMIIGTDPTTGDLRSWTFENDGGFGQGTCNRDGKTWVFESSTTLSNGKVLAAKNVLAPIDHDSFTWQPVNLSVDGEQVADLPPVKVTRVK